MKHFNKKFLLTLVWSFVLSGSVLFGQRQITGRVTDADNGEALIGASVIVKGTTVGAITDFDGRYTLRLPDDATEIRYSYTGYAEVILAIGTSDVMDVQLSPGTALDEVLVIGYGSIKKEDATGTVNAVSEKSFNRGAIVNPEQLLAGKVAGVSITPNSGEPGAAASIRIRGGTSVGASNEPLFVIDGVPLKNDGYAGGRNPLNFLNPSDIETITVLKDASAAAIYGSRGANGVIIITTKKGQKGARPRLTYDGYYTTSSFNEKPNVLNAEQFRNVVTFVAPNRLEKLGNANTNWFDEITQTAGGHSHSLSFSNGGTNSGFRASVGYQQLEGVMRTSELERTSISINYNQAMFDDRLNINVNAKGALTTNQFDPGQIGAAWALDPTQPVYDPTNTAFGGFFEYGFSGAPRNPVSAYSQIENRGKAFRNLGNLEAEYFFKNWVPGLSAKINLGYDATNGEQQIFTPTTYQNKIVSNRDGNIRSEGFSRINPLLEYYMNYRKELGENHRFDVTGGYSYQDFIEKYQGYDAFDLTTNSLGVGGAGSALQSIPFFSEVQNRLISFFGRVNYSFKDRYLFTATVRRDGSTRFGPNNRWGTFPSAAFAWRIMQEDWAQGISSTLSDLKLRLSYGITGNQDILNFGYLPTYRFGDVRARYQFGFDNGQPVFVTTARPNGYDPNLKWEETSSYNVGLDFGFLNGRINGSIDYYYKRTKDLLFTVNIPAGTNLTDRILTNIGELENKGIELALDGYVLNKRDLSWNLGFNIAANQNKVLAIDRISDQGVLTGGISGGVGNFVQILQVGQPVNSFFVFKQKFDANGKPLTDGVDYNDDGVINLADMYEDVNGDGKVDDNDKRPYKKPAADLLIGITSSFNFKGIDLTFTLRGNAGNYVYNNNASNGGYFNRVNERGDIFLNNLHTSALVSNFNGPQYFSDFYVEDASFLRMDNITLGYTLPKMPGRSSLRLYVTAQNPFVWTRYTGLNPEVAGGIDNNPYPWSRAYVFGMSLGL
ncbi:MAG: TonB-dependent receptor [Saprospiraceae bacterium]|nr:TonB-dependent receptor [Saprospiraceae bacterium]